MAEFIFSADTTLEIAQNIIDTVIIPDIFPVKVERELIKCRDCKYAKIYPEFPDRPYCEARMFGKAVDPEFFCADGKRK